MGRGGGQAPRRGGRGRRRARDRARDERLESLAAAPWVVQPLVESVRTTGETSVYVFAGRAVSQVDKPRRRERDPGPRAVRREHRSVDLGAEQRALAEAAVARPAGGAELPYARVDMMRWEAPGR